MIVQTLFLRDLKELKVKRQQLWAIAYKTEEQIEQLAQYDIQISQLEQASLQWQISDADENTLSKLDTYKLNAEASVTVDHNHDEENNSPKISKTIKLGANYNSDNLSIGANYSNIISANLNGNVTNEYVANAQINYIDEKYSLEGISSYLKQKDLSNFEQKIALTYGRLKAALGEKIITTRVQNNATGTLRDVTTYTTTANFGYSSKKLDININSEITPNKEIISINEDGSEKIEHGIGYVTDAQITYKTKLFSNTAGVNISSDSKTFSLSSKANIKPISFGHFNLQISPTMSSSYVHTDSNSFYLAPTLNTTICYQKDDLNISLNMNENYNAKLEKGTNPNLNHNFSTCLNTSIKGIGLTFNYNNSDNCNEHSNTYGISGSYTTSKNGTWSIEYSHRNVKNKTSEQNKNENNINVTYSYKFGDTKKEKPIAYQNY